MGRAWMPLYVGDYLRDTTGLSVAQWRRIREPVQAKFSEGWKHKRIEAELAKVDRALVQRRLAGRNGGIKSGIARAVAQGEAIIQAEAKAKRALSRSPSGTQAGGEAARQQPRTNHIHNFSSFPSAAQNGVGLDRDPRELPKKIAPPKPANQWSRQELDALFARRVAGPGDAPAPQAPAPRGPTDEASSNKQTGV